MDTAFHHHPFQTSRALVWRHPLQAILQLRTRPRRCFERPVRFGHAEHFLCVERQFGAVCLELAHDGGAVGGAECFRRAERLLHAEPVRCAQRQCGAVYLGMD